MGRLLVGVTRALPFCAVLLVLPAIVASQARSTPSETGILVRIMPLPSDSSTLMSEEEVREHLERRKQIAAVSNRVAAEASIDALTALARRLHAEDPRSSFRIFTDGNEEQFRRFMLWDIHYAKDDSARYPYPEAWGNRHDIAMINEFGDRGPRGLTLCWRLQINGDVGSSPPCHPDTS